MNHGRQSAASAFFNSLLDLAKQQERPREIVGAATAQAKLVGLLVDHKEVEQPRDFDRMTDITGILEAVRRDAGEEAAEALAKAFTIMPKSEPT
jgi:hypothetical protein